MGIGRSGVGRIVTVMRLHRVCSRAGQNKGQSWPGNLEKTDLAIRQLRFPTDKSLRLARSTTEPLPFV